VLELEALVEELSGALESAGQELRYLRTRRDVFYRLSFNKAEADGFLNARQGTRGDAMTEYIDFLQSKRIIFPTHGISVNGSLSPALFDFQHDITRWLCKKGRAACFLDTGLGKTPIQCEWARQMDEQTLIIAPLSVARQTIRIAKEVLDMDVEYVRSQDDITGKFNITNYEMIKHFDFDKFGSVVLDESSILKSIAGKIRARLTAVCANVPYKLSCTATPAPNDHTELGNQAEWLGVMMADEMRARFFINANKEHTYSIDGKSYHRKGSNKGGQEWRLRHHGEDPFFRWLASWSVCLTTPSDLGYDDDGFILPQLNISPHFVSSDYIPDDHLMFTHIRGIKEASHIRRETANKRLDLLKEIIGNGSPSDQWVIWCGLNDESTMLVDAFDDAIEVRGSDNPELKARRFEAFQDGLYRILITKPRIGGFGMNFQNAHKMAFFGLNYSWEQYYQAIRREWRYKQDHDVDVHVIMSDIEQGIWRDIQRKDAMAKRLRQGLIDHLRDYEKGELEMNVVDRTPYDMDTQTGDGWTAMLGDSCERMQSLESNSVDLSVYSPPFADLYTYTDSERDLGNCRDWDEFFNHYAYIVRELLRVTKPGRVTCCHAMDIPARKMHDGYIGIKDFSGALIRAYESEGWTLHGRVMIDKNPQAQAIRTHSKGLLFVQLGKDSSWSRPAIPDQVLVFRKPGENQVPVTPVKNGEMDNEVWIRWARPIWYAADYAPANLPNEDGIAETNTLQFGRARDTGDEKHICPLQLGTIERCIKLWSNPGETVLSPFAGIGSEGYQALRFGRKYIGIELKDSYFRILLENLKNAVAEAAMPDLFSFAGIEI
jgi:DNA modification methylase